MNSTQVALLALLLSEAICLLGLACSPKSDGHSTVESRQVGTGVKPDNPASPAIPCKSDQDCAPSQVCVRTGGELGTCLDSESAGCRSNKDCAQGQKCVLISSHRSVCQITIGGFVPGTKEGIRVGGVGLRKKRTTNCRGSEPCVKQGGDVEDLVIRHPIKLPRRIPPIY